MAIQSPQGIDFSFFAGEDLSGDQFKFVKLDPNGNVIKCTGVTDQPVGVLQNDPASGEEASVMITGISKVNASGVLALNAVIATDAASQAQVAVALQFPVGRVIELPAATASGGLVSCAINCSNPVVF